MSPDDNGSDETGFLLHETDASGLRNRQEMSAGHHFMRAQGSSIMLAILTFIYREYCKARLAEMPGHRLGG